MRWVGFIAFLLLVVFYGFAWVRIGLYQKRLNNASLQLNILSEINQIKIQQESLSNLISQSRAKELPVSEYLKTLSTICGTNIFLTNLSLSLETKTGLIDGYIANTTKEPEELLSKFVHDLENTSYILDGTVGTVSKDTDNFTTRFNITLKLK